MTKSEPAILSAFASLRFMGDRLDPDRVTTILGAAPTTAYRKGEIFKRSRGHEMRGRTGLWLVSSERRVASLELDHHLRYLLAIVFPEDSNKRLQALRDLMRDEQLTADVLCFWYGESGARLPTIAEELRSAFARLPAEIETDFHTD